MTPNATATGIAGCMMPHGSLEELRLQNAKDHDARMRELERNQISTWSEMAELAIVVRDNREWELLGFSSWNKWLEDAAPQSRAAMYAGVGLLETLKEDVSKEDLKQIPMSTAKVMKQLPKSMRRDKQVVHRAKTLAPKKFVADVQQRAPELHIEKQAPRKLGFSESQAKIIDGTIEMYRKVEGKPEATDEEAIEAFAAEWALAHADEWNALKAESGTGPVQ